MQSVKQVDVQQYKGRSRTHGFDTKPCHLMVRVKSGSWYLFEQVVHTHTPAMVYQLNDPTRDETVTATFILIESNNDSLKGSCGQPIKSKRLLAVGDLFEWVIYDGRGGKQMMKSSAITSIEIGN